MSLRYPDRVVIVTGGSKGIGRGIVKVFVENGAKVVFCARGGAAGEALEAELNKTGPGSCKFVTCDISKEDDIKVLCDINELAGQTPDAAAAIKTGETHQLLGRMGTEGESGLAALYLAADATFCTGIDLLLSGGAELNYGIKSQIPS
uniref:Hydroxysteroid (17-beta) dehydrogenase 14 n=1 Tax=Gasterosteus aculeatus aculeatus TaxID=481459 RepID=A0AAQ4RHZ9_GASAC